MQMPISSTILSILALTPAALAAKPPKNAILLSNVKSLTLRDNAKTSHRRVPAIPQLTCKGPGCRHHKVDIMRCTNQGSDYEKEDIQWSCTANVPPEFKLGSTEVTCEGYSSSKDEFVLKGSCGVEYRLLLTDLGEEKYGSSSFWGDNHGEGSTVGSVLFGALFFGVAAWILYSMYQAYMNPGGAQRPRRRPGGGFFGGGWGPGGGGGGGGGGWDDPPPPYPGTGKRYGNSGQQQGFQPGFWTGALGGAAAGYMSGNRGGRQQQQQYQQQPGGSWFGGGGRTNSGGSGWGSNGRSSSSSSGARHESTGFGSTARR